MWRQSRDQRYTLPTEPPISYYLCVFPTSAFLWSPFMYSIISLPLSLTRPEPSQGAIISIPSRKVGFEVGYPTIPYFLSSCTLLARKVLHKSTASVYSVLVVSIGVAGFTVLSVTHLDVSRVACACNTSNRSDHLAHSRLERCCLGWVQGLRLAWIETVSDVLVKLPQGGVVE